MTMAERFNPDHLKNQVSQKSLEKPGRKGLFLLEKAMRGYEDLLLMADVHTKMGIQAGFIGQDMYRGAIKNRDSIRRFILEQGSSSEPVKGLGSYLVDEVQQDAERAGMAQIQIKKGSSFTAERIKGPLNMVDNVFLPQLLAWTRDSRRVFSLDEEGAILHAGNSYDDFTWDDILMPFPSFMIELRGSPITINGVRGERMAMSGLLVTHLNSIDPNTHLEDTFECRVFLSDFNEKEPGVRPFLNAEVRKRAEGIVQGDFSNVDDYVNAVEERFTDDSEYLSPYGFALRIRLSEPVVDPSLRTETNIIRKIIAGTCLYLAHAPGKEIGVEDIRGEGWCPATDNKKSKPLKKLLPENLIRNEAQVLTIEKVHEFDPKTGRIKYEDKTGKMVEVHARRAHKRRPPGTPLDTEKTISVKSTWVHRDLLPRDALPAGAVTIIKQRTLSDPNKA